MFLLFIALLVPSGRSFCGCQKLALRYPCMFNAQCENSFLWVYKHSHQGAMSDKKFNDKIPRMVYLCKPHNNITELHQKQGIILPCRILDLEEDGIADETHQAFPELIPTPT